MIETKRSDIIWSYIGIFFNIAMGIIILPIITITMTEVDIGIWYVFTAIQGLVVLVDFGFGPTFARNITYAYSGIGDISATGLSEISDEDCKEGINFELMSKLYKIGKRIYLIISLIAFALMLIAGTAYLYTILPAQNLQYYIAWLIFAVAITLNIMFSYYPSFLQGLGQVKRCYQTYFFSRLVFIVVGTVGLLLGFGLIALAVMMLLSSVTIRVISAIFIRKSINIKEINSYKIEKQEFKRIFTKLWVNIRKEGIIAVGNFASSKSLTFIAASFLGLEMSARYGLSIQLFGILSTLSVAYLTSNMPNVISKQLKDEKGEISIIYGRSLIMMVLLFIIGIIGIVFVAPLLLNLIGSNTSLLSIELLFAIGILALLQRNYQMSCMIISSRNKLVYAWPFFISGFLVLGVSALLMVLFPTIGVWNIVIGQAIVECAFNNWFWPYYVSRKLGLGYFSAIKNGTKSFIKFKKKEI